jgi:GTPase SAR1 family protein
VISDSFHACVFSIIFRKQFLVIGNPKRGMARFETLLKYFGLENHLMIYRYPNIPFDHNEKPLCKSIMAVGETGSGKTTLLNSFLNFLMEIKYEDTFRYKIIVENKSNKAGGESVTDNVSIYYIRTTLKDLPYLRIVDTPGFGDTRGKANNKKIIDMIRKTITDYCDTINAICFVVKSNETRLTDFQRYIFAQVMALFGKDVGENFLAMLTFSDGQVPNIVQSLENPDSIFSQIKDQIQNPWYLTFNNSAIFNGIEQKFSRSFWDLGMASYQCFLTKLKMLPQKSLVLSKQVLELRQKLEATITGLRPQIDKSLVIIENIRKEIAFVKANKDKIDQFKEFKYKYKEPKITKK